MADELGGFGNQLALMNPAAAAAMRRAAYAQALLQQGSDASPVRSPWQAAARAVQGALGGYEMYSSQNELQDINTQQRAEAAAKQKEVLDLLGGRAAGQGAGTGGTGPAAAAPAPTPTPVPSPSPAAIGTPGGGQGASNAGDGKLPPTPQLATIASPGGAKLSVAAPYADRFQGLVNDLDAAGYKIDPSQTGGFNSRFIASTNTPSQHASGAAVDINWTRNARGGQGDIPPELARSLAAKYGLTWGGDWSGNTRDPMHFEIAPDGRYTVAAGSGGSQIDVAPSPIAPPSQGGGQVAAGGAGGQAAPGAGGAAAAAGPPNLAQARALFGKALEMETSPNPFVRAMAGSVRAQATALMSMGAWTQPVPVPGSPGQFMIHNGLSGETKAIGTTNRLATDAAGNLVGPDGRVVVQSPGFHPGPPTASGAQTDVSPSGQRSVVGTGPDTYKGTDGGIYNKADNKLIQANPGWAPVGPTAGGGTLYRDEKGGMHTVESTARPETQFANTISTVNAKIKSGQALSQQEFDNYTAAYNGLYPFTQKWNADQKAWNLVQEKPPTGDVIRPQDLPQPGVTPQPPGEGAGPPTQTAPVVTRPAENVRTSEVAQQSVAKQMEGDFGKANEEMDAAAGSRAVIGQNATIRSLTPSVRTGYGAEAQAHLGSVLKTLGASDENLQSFMGINPSNAEALQKTFLQLTSTAVRGMGAREPGSVISMFAKAYPSLASQPATIDMITRLVDMDQHYKEDRANAKLDYLNNQRATMNNPTDYKGQQGFHNTWEKENDPRTYVGAALAASGQPYSVWSKQLSEPQQQQALQLVRRWNDVKQVMGPDKPYILQQGNQ